MSVAEKTVRVIERFLADISGVRDEHFERTTCLFAAERFAEWLALQSLVIRRTGQEITCPGDATPCTNLWARLPASVVSGREWRR